MQSQPDIVPPPERPLFRVTSRSAADEQADLECLLAWRERGHHGAARKLFRCHFDAIFRFFRNKVADPSDASDLVIETFARLFRRRDQYPEILSVRCYTFGIARRVLLGYIRQRHRPDVRDLLEQSLVELYPRSLSSIVFTCRRLHALTCALRTLPLAEQILLEAKYFEGMSEREQAALLEIPQSTVPGRARAARNHLQEAVLKHLAVLGPRRDSEAPVCLDELIDALRREMARGAGAPTP